ncbi:uncharacterized protein C15orf39 homolog [Aulostomus maculatus]
MENGPSTEYDQNWMQTDAYYSKRLPIQRKPQDPLLQRRGLQFEPSAEQLKRAEIYSPSRARTLPAGIEPNYSSYPCTPTHTAFGSLSEQSQHIHTSPRGYPSLYPSHPTYEHMTSEVYQERSPMSKYGNKHSSPTSSSATTASKGRLKRSISHLSPPIKVEDEDRDLCVVDLNKKRQKLEMESVQVRHDADSPPMPVIDNVFSLAPYQAYLQASGVLFPGVVPKGRVASEPIKPKLCVKEKRLVGDKHQPVVSKDIFPDTPTEKPVVELLEPKNIKLEKVGPTDKKNTVDSSATVTDCSKMSIKKEPEDTGFSGRGPVTVRKSEPNEHERTSLSADDKRTSSESKPAESIAKVDSQSLDDASTPQQQVVSFKYKPITPPQLPEAQHNFQNLPPQCLKLPTYKIMVPDTQQSSPVPPQENPLTRLMTDFTPHSELKIPARKHFFELHRSLCKLVSQSVSTSSEQELRTWLSQLELGDPASPLNKVKKVSCLLGPKAREKWLKEEVKIALQEILERLREYTAQERCPFPHVMRRGAVFLPMLVVKEQLFPMVQGSYVDQVLQEHRVELRPTTLSEEKILIQLHKRACSSRLRRLMSLKHLPDIYADVLNLSYYTYVCKHLESTPRDVQKRVQD